MLNPVAVIPATVVSSEASSVHRAFARLERADQQLVEDALFDGRTCVEIARAMGTAPGEIRWRIGTAMLELHAAQMRDEEAGYGAVAAMLALRALDALDADEAAVVDAMVEHQAALMIEYGAYCALVGELCLMVPQIAPRSRVGERLMCATDDALAN